jgi:hypothetical protein
MSAMGRIIGVADAFQAGKEALDDRFGSFGYSRGDNTDNQGTFSLLGEL